MNVTEHFSNLKLSHQAGEWDGTFVLTAAFMIGNLLEDNEPVNVRLSGINPETDGVFYNLDATIVAVDGRTLIADTGKRFDLDDLCQVEVP